MIDKKKFNEQNFTSFGIIEKLRFDEKGRVAKDWKPSQASSVDLRNDLRDIMWDKTDAYRSEIGENMGDYPIIDILCRIPPDTMKKALNGRYKITRNFLAKFTVGLKLEIDAANKLFKDHSGELNITNDFDYIVYHALKTKDDINDFIQELDDLIGINLDRS